MSIMAVIMMKSTFDDEADDVADNMTMAIFRTTPIIMLIMTTI